MLVYLVYLAGVGVEAKAGQGCCLFLCCIRWLTLLTPCAFAPSRCPAPPSFSRDTLFFWLLSLPWRRAPQSVSSSGSPLSFCAGPAPFRETFPPAPQPPRPSQPLLPTHALSVWPSSVFILKFCTPPSCSSPAVVRVTWSLIDACVNDNPHQTLSAACGQDSLNR